jgi:hypothetical protein
LSKAGYGRSLFSEISDKRTCQEAGTFSSLDRA